MGFLALYILDFIMKIIAYLIIIVNIYLNPNLYYTEYILKNWLK